jgi:hypothetical protein
MVAGVAQIACRLGNFAFGIAGAAQRHADPGTRHACLGQFMGEAHGRQQVVHREPLGDQQRIGGLRHLQGLRVSKASCIVDKAIGLSVARLSAPALRCRSARHAPPDAARLRSAGGPIPAMSPAARRGQPAGCDGHDRRIRAPAAAPARILRRPLSATHSQRRAQTLRNPWGTDRSYPLRTGNVGGNDLGVQACKRAKLARWASHPGARPLMISAQARHQHHHPAHRHLGSAA